MIPFRKENSEVLYPEEDLVLLESLDLEELKRLAFLNKRRRIRLCTHWSPDEALHEMFIVLAADCYVRPHKRETESMTVLEGSADAVLFHDDGAIRQIIEMGPFPSGKTFYYKFCQPVLHTLLIKTDFLLFYEVTRGPFKREMTVFPDWAPEEGASERFQFVDDLKRKTEALKVRSKQEQRP